MPDPAHALHDGVKDSDNRMTEFASAHTKADLGYGQSENDRQPI